MIERLQKSLVWHDFKQVKPANNGEGCSDRCIFFRRPTGCAVLGRLFFGEDEEGNEHIDYALQGVENWQPETSAFVRSITCWAYLDSALPTESDFAALPQKG